MELNRLNVERKLACVKKEIKNKQNANRLIKSFLYNCSLCIVLVLMLLLKEKWNTCRSIDVITILILFLLTID